MAGLTPRSLVWEEAGVELPEDKRWVGQEWKHLLTPQPRLCPSALCSGVSMAAVWHPVNANVCKAGEVTTAPAVSQAGDCRAVLLCLQGGTPSLPGDRCLGLQGNHPAESTAASCLFWGCGAADGPKARHGGMCGDHETETGANWRSWGGAQHPGAAPFHPLIPQLSPRSVGGRGSAASPATAAARSCDPQVGACSCPSGLQPPHCLQPCTPGLYGPACQFSCQCQGRPVTPRPGACLCPQKLGPTYASGRNAH